VFPKELSPPQVQSLARNENLATTALDDVSGRLDIPIHDEEGTDGQQPNEFSARGTPEDVADPRAIREVEKEKASAEKELADAKRWNDLARISSATENIEKLLEYLNQARGLGNRKRQMPGPNNSARGTVQKGIKRAIDRIEQADAAAARFLEKRISTGWKVFFDYDGPEVNWQFYKNLSLHAQLQLTTLPQFSRLLPKFFTPGQLKSQLGQPRSRYPN
jgi:hypothetical protein